MLIRTTYVMPTVSNARTAVDCLMPTHLSFAQAEWLEGDSGNTFLYLTYPAARAETVDRIIQRAHPRIVERSRDVLGSTATG